jgi:hypothetical protein
VVDRIKRFAPAKLKVVLRDGTEKPVAVPKIRNRWSRVVQVLESLPWQSIECLDKDGSVLGVVDGPEEDLPEEFDDAADGSAALAKVLLDVMRTTMKETRQLVDAQMRGVADMMQSMAEGARALNEVYRNAIAAQQAYLVAPPGKEDDGADGAMMKMMQMALMLNQQQPRTQVAPPKKEG